MSDADDEPASGALIDKGDIERLSARIARIQKSGLVTPSQKLFELASQESPGELMRSFFNSASPSVTQAMQDAVVALVGSLPAMEFDAQVSTTGDKLAALMLQLQMTGYMLRNAEYVVALRQLLDIHSRDVSDYRAAFERLDLDGSGYIEKAEVKALLSEVYAKAGVEVPPYEVSSFMRLFDVNADGKISWEEFAAALGASLDGAPRKRQDQLPAAADGDAAPAVVPALEGCVTVSMADGTELEVDANEYMEELRLEATRLQQELLALAREEEQRSAAISGSISAYVSSLSEPQLKVLTSGISADVVEAMKKLVSYILKAPDGGPLDMGRSISMEQDKLKQLCLYQLVLGYRLREAEAKGEAESAIGR